MTCKKKLHYAFMTLKKENTNNLFEDKYVFENLIPIPRDFVMIAWNPHTVKWDVKNISLFYYLFILKTDVQLY